MSSRSIIHPSLTRLFNLCDSINLLYVLGYCISCKSNGYFYSFLSSLILLYFFLSKEGYTRTRVSLECVSIHTKGLSRVWIVLP